MKKTLLVLSALALSFGAAAKLPAPSDEAKAKGITLSGSQEYRLAMSLAAHNGITNPNQIATGRTLQTDKLGAMIQDLPNLNAALAKNNANTP